jgi:hypothetical protein
MLVLGSSVYLYLFAFFPPFIPVFSGIDDYLLYLAPAQRMVEGQLIYRDFFEFVTPGTALLNLFFFKLFGLRPWIPNLLTVLLGVCLAGVGLAIARKLISPGFALLPSALFLLDARFYLANPVHHWYSSLAAMAGIAVVIEHRTPPRIFAAGVFCGLCASFTQTKGLAAALGFLVFLWWEFRQLQTGRREFFRNVAWFTAGFAATLLLLNGYFIWQAGPARFFWCTVVYVLTYYRQQADWNTLLALHGSLNGGTADPHSIRFYESIAKMLIDLWAVPCACILVLARYFLRLGKNSWDDWSRPVLVAIVGLFLFLSMAPAPSPPRTVPNSLLGFILLIWLLDSRGKIARGLLAVISVGVLAAAAFSVIHSRPNEIATLTTAHGKLGFAQDTEDTFSEYDWVQQHTQPGQFFYEAAFPDMYFYLDLRNPTPLPLVTNNAYTTTTQVKDVIDGLEQHRTQNIVWDSLHLDSIPQWENPSDAHLQPLRDYIRVHYDLVKVFSDPGDEIWERRPD